MGVYLREVHLVGMDLMSVLLPDVYLRGMHPIGLHLQGVHLMGISHVHVRGSHHTKSVSAWYDMPTAASIPRLGLGKTSQSPI
jgi:hypothetical protein